MSSAETLFQQAKQTQRSGNLAGAEALYRQSLALNPNHADALHFLGVCLYQAGRNQEAFDFIRHSIQLVPSSSVYQNNMGLVCRALNRLDDATNAFETSLRLTPDNPIAFYNLGVLRLEENRFVEAQWCFEQLKRTTPSDPRASQYLGRTFLALGKTDEAIAEFRESLAIDPRQAETHNQLGLALLKKEKPKDAVAEFREAVKLAPDMADALTNLGATLCKLNQPEEGLPHLHRVQELCPRSLQAQHRLGMAYHQLGKLDEAERHFREVLKLQPDHYGAAVNLGSICSERREHHKAIEWYEHALWMKPDDPDAHWNRALIWLTLGKFEQGLLEYEWRWHLPAADKRRLPRPRWDGEPLEGRKILLHGEQGLGDTLQFARYIPRVVERGGKVLLAVQKPLLKLFSLIPNVEGVHTFERDFPVFDVHAPLMSLTRMFDPQLKDPGSPSPYLWADPQLVERWREKLAGIAGFKIGIAWQGNSAYRYDHLRSVQLRNFAPLADVPGVRLVSLQKGKGNEQLKEARDQFDIVQFDDLDTESGPFMDTAALMQCVDLVICSDSAVAHLAGGLGVKTWLATPWLADWRWLLEREDCPWYPNMRLFRQPAVSEWKPVFERMADELRKIVS